jgi:hypothetical protein
MYQVCEVCGDKPMIPMEAKIGDKYFEKLQDAIDSVKTTSETVITVYADLDGMETVYVGKSNVQNIVIDLNGHTIKSSGVAFTVQRAKATLTLKNGTVIGNSTAGTLRSLYSATLILGDNLTVEAGAQAVAIYVNKANLVINSKTVTVTAGKEIIKEVKPSDIKISGGTFGCDVAEWVVDECISSSNGDGTYTVVAKAPAELPEDEF